ncbi:AAA family ATPase [Paenibacillus sp. SYP-B3998]|uniref:AAA family ATPase n=1 Tax=Paenibacillus sp. SYP-B3998 TaxID=2678564 RepID=A0A6G4A1F1_9BACL|nr:RNA polymerase recycling motor HelD [Paenibacillus sp. SYP-B3998]NEW08205.1 AAA family ATPase [Paenibacillus sp. SYP-B3998]
MSVKYESWQEEQERVDKVLSEIDKQTIELQGDANEKKSDIVEFRKNFWGDVSVNFDDAGTYSSLKQQTEVLSEIERTYHQAQKKLKTLAKLKQSPYFGRIDFLDAFSKEDQQIYLGIASLVDDDGINFLVYDWRAPVSNLYYDYSPGPAKYETPSGIISGEMTVKRQYIIRHARITSMFDTAVTIGDELLQDVLGKQSNSQMKSIVATIQREQNLIIRNVSSQMLVVQGAAGSGKTSAALQRVAYLLYRYRETLRADQIILFSPNPMFNSYVSTVLPELGEENMEQTTFQAYLDHRLGGTFQMEDSFSQIEYTLSAMDKVGYEERIEGIRFKASQEFMQLIEQYIVDLGSEGMEFKDITFRDEVLFPAERIREQFYTHDSAMRIPNRMALLSEWLLKELKKKAVEEMAKPWVEDEIELLDKEEYLWAFKELQKQNRFAGNTFDDYNSERGFLAEKVVDLFFKPVRQGIQQFRYVNIPLIYQQLFRNPAYVPWFTVNNRFPQHWLKICKLTIEKLERSELFYEDATPFLYLTECIEGFQVNNRVRHVFIDEAQDFSTFQFVFIKRLFPRSKMTVLGDWNQRIFIHDTASSNMGTLNALYGEKATESLTLTRSYRSTRQIIEFTRALIEGGEAIKPFNREGNKPTLKKANDTAELVTHVVNSIQELQADGHRTIAVICKTAKESSEANEALKDKVKVRLIEKETASFQEGILVIPTYLAKGVEFDAVIIFDASQTQYGRSSERKLFYTACTRAMHDLHICFNGEMNPLIARASHATYNLNE